MEPATLTASAGEMVRGYPPSNYQNTPFLDGRVQIKLIHRIGQGHRLIPAQLGCHERDISVPELSVAGVALPA